MARAVGRRNAQVLRRAAVIRALGRVERRERLHRDLRAHTFEIGERWARRSAGELDHVPSKLRPGTVATQRFGPATGSARTRSRSDVVWFGKFDRAGTTRARAFVAGGVAIKLQTEHAEGNGHGLLAEARVRADVARLAPGLAPALRGSGHDPDRGISWIVEETVHGWHPWTPADVDRVLERTVAAVLRLYLAHGITSRPATAVLSPVFRDRLADAATLEPRIGDHLDAVDELLASDRDVEVALGHGDLVGSNVLVPRGDGDVMLVDWEHASVMPVASDVGKVLLQAGDKRAAIAAIAAQLGCHVGVRSASHPLLDQLLLGQLQGLSWFVHRRRRALDAGREAAFERDLIRRLATVAALRAA